MRTIRQYETKNELRNAVSYKPEYSSVLVVLKNIAMSLAMIVDKMYDVEA